MSQTNKCYKSPESKVIVLHSEMAICTGSKYGDRINSTIDDLYYDDLDMD